MHTKYCRRCPHHIKKSSRPAVDRASVIRWTAFRTLYLFPSSGVAVPAYMEPLVQIACDICVSCTDVCSYRSPSMSIFLFETGRIHHTNWYWWVAVECGDLYLHVFYKSFVWVIRKLACKIPRPYHKDVLQFVVSTREGPQPRC